MIIRNFEYLIALAAEGHFGNAAKACHVSQPTLSSGIKQLEEDLDVEIVRHGRRYDGLTEQGEAVLEWAKRMQRDCNSLEQELSARKRSIQGAFRLGAVTGTSGVASVLSRRLAQRMPHIRQTITIQNTQQTLAALRARDIDISLCNLDDATDELETHLLFQERLFEFRATRDPQGGKVTWDDIGKLPLCLLPDALPERALSRLLTQIDPDIETNSVEVLSAYIATGRFAAVLPQSYVCHLAHIPDLHVSALAGPDTQMSIGFASLHGGLMKGLSLALLEITHEIEFERQIEKTLFEYRNFQRSKI